MSPVLQRFYADIIVLDEFMVCVYLYYSGLPHWNVHSYMLKLGFCRIWVELTSIKPWTQQNANHAHDYWDVAYINRSVLEGKLRRLLHISLKDRLSNYCDFTLTKQWSRNHLIVIIRMYNDGNTAYFFAEMPRDYMCHPSYFVLFVANDFPWKVQACTCGLF